MTDTSKVYLTSQGVARLRGRLADARAAYKAVCDTNGEAAESGDSSVWHDNFAFEENQRQMHQLARRVRDLEVLLSRVSLVTEVATHHVAIGSRVRYRVDGAAERTCVIGGWEDGDPGARRVSYNSPLGAGLLGGRVGDEREVVLAGSVRIVEIVSLEPALEDA